MLKVNEQYETFRFFDQATMKNNIILPYVQKPTVPHFLLANAQDSLQMRSY